MKKIWIVLEGPDFDYASFRAATSTRERAQHYADELLPNKFEATSWVSLVGRLHIQAEGRRVHVAEMPLVFSDIVYQWIFCTDVDPAV
jgi:hypothetical protein